MIFAIFGTIPLPFIRLAAAIDQIAGSSSESFLIQSGHTGYLFKNAVSVPFFSDSEMRKHIDDASLVISHGGYGSIFECLQAGKKVIAVPRNEGEHNHDQAELVLALEKAGHIMAVYDVAELERVIAQAADFDPRSLPRGNGKELINQFIQNNTNN